MNRSHSIPTWEPLRDLLARVLEKNSFQRKRWIAAGQRFPESFEEFSECVPLTSKGELAQDQQDFPPFGTNLTREVDRYVHFSQTSGTTARPLAVVDTSESWGWLLENWEMGFRWAGIHPGMRVFFAFSFGPFLGFWTAFQAAQRSGLLSFPGGGLSTLARLKAMERYGVEVLCCTPTYALHLAEVAAREGLLRAGQTLQRILVAGEPGGSLPALRARINDIWPQAEIVDHYGMTEVGPVAFGVAGVPGSLRVLSERYGVEILNAVSGLPVLAGEMGELTLTPLGREDWPLLRYRTGDLVRAARSAEGSIDLSGGILGRVDDMVIVRGVNLYPGAVEQVVRSIPEIGEYRVSVERVGAMAEVEIEVEFEGGQGVCAELERALEVAFALRIPVRQVADGTLPRFEFKARRWRISDAR